MSLRSRLTSCTALGYGLIGVAAWPTVALVGPKNSSCWSSGERRRRRRFHPHRPSRQCLLRSLLSTLSWLACDKSASACSKFRSVLEVLWMELLRGSSPEVAIRQLRSDPMKELGTRSRKRPLPGLQTAGIGNPIRLFYATRSDVVNPIHLKKGAG